MKEHYNLYHIFIEDMQENLLDPKKQKEIRRVLEKLYEEKNFEKNFKKIKPDESSEPLIDKRTKKEN